jgi:integrase
VRALIELAAGSKSPEWATVITFAALTGMRRGELCGLRWSYVEWIGGAINVRRSIWQTKDRWGAKDPESHQVRRLVLGEQTMGVLTGRYQCVSDNVAMAEISLSPDAYVFSPDLDVSKPMLPGAVTLAFRRLYNTMAEKTNDEWPYRFHDLGHYTATELFRAGHNARTVADRLGHADPSLTLRFTPTTRRTSPSLRRSRTRSESSLADCHSLALPWAHGSPGPLRQRHPCRAGGLLADGEPRAWLRLAARWAAAGRRS